MLKKTLTYKNKQIDVDPLPPIVINIFFSIKYFFENTFLCEKYIFLGKGKGRGKEFWSLDTLKFWFSIQNFTGF